jgi:quercetin dioxygenase-like cupin family protein
MKRTALVLLVLAALPAARAQTAMQLYPSSASLPWKAAPPAMPKGVMVAVLEGDPTRAGLFTMRIRFPAGTRVMPHFHSATEHATVIAGVLHIGMGDSFDSTKTRIMAPGSFGFWPAGTHHFAWVEGETTLQLHGQGPWTVTYVNAADDPRSKH